MTFRSRIIFAASLVFSVFLLHAVATVFHLYWTYVWFDTFMHAFGGFAAAFFLLSTTKHGFQGRPLLFLALVYGLGAGTAWEIFEYITGYTFLLPGETYIGDTATDFLMDAIGSVGAFFLYKKYAK